jgi:hypothetical protein
MEQERVTDTENEKKGNFKKVSLGLVSTFGRF